MTPTIKYQIKDRVSIFSDVVPKNLLDDCINLISENIKIDNYFIRFDYRDNNNYKVHVYDHFNNIDEQTKTMFRDKSPKADEQKVIQVGSGGTKESKNLLPYYQNLIESLHPDKIFYPDVQDFFYYNPGSYMNRHSDFVDKRLCTTILYLNDQNKGDVGGELVFYDDNRKVIYEYQPKMGDIVIMDDIEHSVSKIENWYRLTHRVYWNYITGEDDDN